MNEWMNERTNERTNELRIYQLGLDIETKFPYFSYLTWLSIIRNQEFRLYI